ncbi:unnamed protein product [Sphagnum jensenii]|uniref:Uncharacterized protein n=1 Tax=Sphagnum jensenii TaxID=128206 RepID=A0ABP0VIG9_9BRYO
MEWMGTRRRDRWIVQHDACCFGINHQVNGYSHQLFVLDAESEEEESGESVPDEPVAPTCDVHVTENEEQEMPKRRKTPYYDRKQQLELVLAAQELSELGDPGLNPAKLDEEEERGVKHKCADIWQDEECLRLIREGILSEEVLRNVEQAQMQQKKVYAARKGKHLFEGLVTGQTMVKMKKPGKRRALSASWEGPYQFVGHSDGKGNLDFEEGCRLCIVQDGEGHQWERSRRDLQIFYIPLD